MVSTMETRGNGNELFFVGSSTPGGSGYSSSNSWESFSSQGSKAPSMLIRCQGFRKSTSYRKRQTLNDAVHPLRLSHKILLRQGKQVSLKATLLANKISRMMCRPNRRRRIRDPQRDPKASQSVKAWSKAGTSNEALYQIPMLLSRI